MPRPSGRLVQGARRAPARTSSIRALPRMIASPPCRRCVCLVGPVAVPRSIACPHDTWWRPSVSCADVPRGRWLLGGGGGGVVLLRWTPHIFARLWKSCYSNWRPWSVVIVCGHPKRGIQPESSARDTICCAVRDGERFPAASETIYNSEAVLKSCRGR